MDRERPPVLLRRPALTIGLPPQPEVLTGLAKKRDFRGRGLLARFLFGLPISRLGERKLVSRPVPDDMRNAYHRIRRVLDLPFTTGEDGIQRPHLLRFDAAAYNRWKAFQTGVEAMMREGGQLEHLRDCGSS